MWAIPPLLCDPNEILVLNCTHSSDSLVFSPAMCTGVQTFHMVILIYRKVWVSPLVLPLSISLFVCIHLGLSSLFPVIPVKDPLLSLGLNSLLAKMFFPLLLSWILSLPNITWSSKSVHGDKRQHPIVNTSYPSGPQKTIPPSWDFSLHLQDQDTTLAMHVLDHHIQHHVVMPGLFLPCCWCLCGRAVGGRSLMTEKAMAISLQQLNRDLVSSKPPQTASFVNRWTDQKWDSSPNYHTAAGQIITIVSSQHAIYVH